MKLRTVRELPCHQTKKTNRKNEKSHVSGYVNFNQPTYHKSFLSDSTRNKHEPAERSRYDAPRPRNTQENWNWNGTESKWKVLPNQQNAQNQKKGTDLLQIAIDFLCLGREGLMHWGITLSSWKQEKVLTAIKSKWPLYQGLLVFLLVFVITKFTNI